MFVGCMLAKYHTSSSNKVMTMLWSKGLFSNLHVCKVKAVRPDPIFKTHFGSLPAY